MLNENTITLAHGNGGVLMQKLINKMILSAFGNPILNRLDDAAVIKPYANKDRLAFTTDSFVVNPIFFPGGNIGKLAVCGTVNDLSMMGAKPLFLSASVIIEEGFKTQELKKIIDVMRETTKEAGVEIVCGDTKVVNKGHCDKIFINTAGIGILRHKQAISSSSAKPGDLIIVSGTIGEHGIAIMSLREGLKFNTVLKSDCAPLNVLVESMLQFKKSLHVMRDPTRGGTATALNEIAELSNVGIEIDEDEIPVSDSVQGASEILGLDPLYLPCEGRLLAVVKPDEAKAILKTMHKNRYGKGAKIIGCVVGKHKKQVYLNTITGSQRIVDMPIIEQMPRIC